MGGLCHFRRLSNPVEVFKLQVESTVTLSHWPMPIRDNNGKFSR